MDQGYPHSGHLCSITSLVIWFPNQDLVVIEMPSWQLYDNRCICPKPRTQIAPDVEKGRLLSLRNIYEHMQKESFDSHPSKARAAVPKVIVTQSIPP